MTVVAQGRALLRMSIQGVMNSLRHRQGKGALVVFPLLLTVLLVELARFGGKGADGVRRFLAAAPVDRGTHFVALWLSVMGAAVVALKYARAIPGRGSRPLFDTLLFRALPVSPLTRTLFELLVGSTHAVGFVALAFSPALYGLVTQRFEGSTAVLLTAGLAVLLNGVATLVAHALHALVSRYLGGRALDLVRVVTACAGFLLVGLFSTIGPIGVGFAHRLRVLLGAPWWSAWLPLRGLVRWVRFDDASGLAQLGAWTAALVVLSIAALVWRVRAPTDLSLDGPSAPTGAGKWEAAFRGPRVEWRMLSRQAPYLVLATPAFLLFFLGVVKGARAATGMDLPFVTLMGLIGWALVVQGTALTGAASRRWRRVLWLLPTTGRDHRDAIRALAGAHFGMTVGLALAAGLPWFFTPRPLWWWFPRQFIGMVLVIAVGQWAQSAALFLLIDPSPDRLTGLSVGGVFGVLVTALPTVALVVLLSATGLPTWLSLVALLALLAWSLESSAVARLRWIREPGGDAEAELRTWPALRSFGVAGLAQVVVAQAGDALGAGATTTLVLSLLVFAGVLLPLAWRGAQRHAVEARWSLARSVATGVLVGAANFALVLGVARLVHPGASGGSPLAAAFTQTRGWVLAAIVVASTTVIPLAEESFFRGWLMPAVRREVGDARVAVALSAAVFAMVHAGAAWAPALWAGLLAGVLMQRSGRLATSLAMHVTNNALVVLAVLLGR
jgi:membrane protease YdiL (CAAX protease family)